jgi:hypothetical protein
LDLENNDSIVWDTLSQQNRRAGETWKAMLACNEVAGQTIEKNPSYQAVLSSLPPQAAVCAALILPKGSSVVVTNSAFVVHFQRDTRGFLEDIAEYKMAPILPLLGTVAPEDRLAFSQFYWEGMFGLAWEGEEQSRSVAKVFKMVNGAGTIGLYLVYFVRSMKQLPGLFFVYEPCPVSRHLNPHPHRNAQLEAFKHCSTAHELEEGKKDEGDGRKRKRRRYRRRGKDEGGSTLAVVAAPTAAVASTYTQGEGGGGGKNVVVEEEEDGASHGLPFLPRFPGLASIPAMLQPGEEEEMPLSLLQTDKVSLLFGPRGDVGANVSVNEDVNLNVNVNGQATEVTATATGTGIDNGGNARQGLVEQAVPLALSLLPPFSPPQTQSHVPPAAATHTHTQMTTPILSAATLSEVQQQWVGLGGGGGEGEEVASPRPPVFDEGALQEIFKE